MGKHSKQSATARTVAALGVAATIPAAVALGAAPAAHAAGPLDAIMECESKGQNVMNYMHAQNPSYYTAGGYFQIVNGTWRNYGGTEFAPTAIQATYEQQRTVAERIYAAEGTTPWNSSKSCWSGKTAAMSGPQDGGNASKVKKSSSDSDTKQIKVKTEAAETKLDAPKAVSTPSVETFQALPVVPSGASFTAGGSGTYTVQLGDTLSSLALEHGTTVGALVDLNKDIIEMPDWIFAGEQIRLK